MVLNRRFAICLCVVAVLAIGERVKRGRFTAKPFPTFRTPDFYYIPLQAGEAAPPCTKFELIRQDQSIREIPMAELLAPVDPVYRVDIADRIAAGRGRGWMKQRIEKLDPMAVSMRITRGECRIALLRSEAWFKPISQELLPLTK